MWLPRRLKWIEGKFANVDGIPFMLPVASRKSPCLFAIFGINPQKAEAFMPGQELHPFRLWNRALLCITVINYGETSIGKYVEFCVGIACTRGPKPAPRFLPAVFSKRYGFGQLVYDLPVSSEISVKGGVTIWGMAKRRANLDFVVGEDVVSSQYDMDGKLMLRIDVVRPRKAWLPVKVKGVGWGHFRGMLTKSYVYIRGKLGFHFRRKGSARLLIGDDPRMQRLKELEIDPDPLVCGFFPETNGVLDDHFECWFLSSDEKPEHPPVGLEIVRELGLSQEWLPPPDRADVDQKNGVFDSSNGK